MPFKSAHSCRLRRPGDFKAGSFRTVDREHEGKTYHVVRGRLKSNDEWEDQSFRYPTAHWDEGEARAHCRAHKGILFEPATGKDGDDKDAMALLPALRHAATGQVWALAPRYMAALSKSLHEGRVDPLLVQTHRGAAHAQYGQDEPAAAAGAIAVVPLVGMLMYRCGPFGALFGVGSTDGFVRLMRAAAANRDVVAILIDVDSPGGMVDGVPEAWQAVMEIRKRKPVYAIANTLMASGAYWIASAADEIIATPSAEVGSIGVFAMHVDISRALDEHGVSVSIIRQPPAKAEANSFEPLSDEARGHLQGQIDETYAEFVKQVAAGRRAKQSVVREQYGQGRTLLAKTALEAGLVDRIATFEELTAALVADLAGKRVRAAAASVGAPAAETGVPSTVAQTPAAVEQDPPRLALAEAEDACPACGGSGLTPESAMSDPQGQEECASCNGSGSRRTAGISPPDVSREMADEDEPWEQPTLDDFTDNPWDELTAAERRRIAMHAAWAEAMPPKAFGDIKLWHHRPDDGKIVLRGVQACGNAMMGARGGVEMPEEDRAAVRRHLERHYHAFTDADGKPRKAPWEEAEHMDEEARQSAAAAAIVADRDQLSMATAETE